MSYYLKLEVKEFEKRIRELERILGRKTLENEILKEAVRIGWKNNWSHGSHFKSLKI
ncbi:Transposase [Estrella lausannensis]|uniref:Transposase n=1 Tax=Estrella lausannensis TaxID=483423 RepID=A0A0H5DQT3_9BACT|nr:Transposase [Estrella lausannensis]